MPGRPRPAAGRPRTPGQRGRLHRCGSSPDERLAPEQPEEPEQPADERSQDGPLAGAYYEPSMNQRRHEPMPASPDDEHAQEAVEQNEAFAHGYEAGRAREGQKEVPGDLTPGPEDPRTPPTHVTAAEPGDGRPGQVRRVSRAGHGRPDGEVDPQS